MEKTCFSDYDPDTASGPPCAHCGTVLVIASSPGRNFWKCPQNEAHGRMSYAQGLDVMTRLREARVELRKREADKLAREFDADDLGIFADFLVDLG